MNVHTFWSAEGNGLGSAMLSGYRRWEAMQNVILEKRLPETRIFTGIEWVSARDCRPTGIKRLSALDQQKHSTAGDLLKFAGSWVGVDLEDCLEAVYENRTKTHF